MKQLKNGLGAILATLLLPMMAHAQDALGVRFTPPDTDLSVHYLASIFGVVGGVLHGVGTQIFGIMFGVFNSAVLSLGGIIVMYIMVIATTSTAHDGEVLGKKWSSVWLPLRSAVGVGLLLPKTTGYCFIQVFVMWVVIQGVGAADSIWAATTNYLGRGGVIITSSFQPSIKGETKAISSIQSLFADLVCMYSLQDALQTKYVDSLDGTTTVDPVPPLASTINPLSSGFKSGGKFKINIPTLTTGDWTQFNGACGSITWDDSGVSAGASSSNGVAGINNARTMAIQQMILTLSNAAERVANQAKNIPLPDTNPNKVYIGQCNTDGNCDYRNWNVINGIKQPSLVEGGLLQKSYASYQGVMYPALRSGYSSVYSSQDPYGSTAGLPGWAIDAQNKGWIMAGSYYYNLARVNDSIRMRADTQIPDITLPPGGPNRPDNLSSAATSFCTSSTSAIKTQLTEDECKTVANATYSPQLQTFLTDSMRYKLPFERSGDKTRFAGGINIGGKAAFILYPFVYPFIGILVDFARLASVESSNENPIVIMSSLGSNMIGVCSIVFILTVIIAIPTFATGAIPCTTVSNGFVTMAIMLAPFISSLLTIMFISGSVLAFYVPMIPFIVFAFAAVGWLIGVIEAMVAAPIVALGLIHPDGPHEHLGKSEQAVMLLTNVFLRPPMMIIGLIAGISVSYVGVWILNAGFGNALKMVAWSINGWAYLFSPLAFAVIYASLALAIIHKAFSLIHVLPDKVLRWLSGGHQESLGESAAGEGLGAAKGATQQAAHYAAQGASQGAQAGTSRVAGMHDGKSDAEKKKVSSEASTGGEAGANPSGGGQSGADSSSGGTSGGTGMQGGGATRPRSGGMDGGSSPGTGPGMQGGSRGGDGDDQS